MDINYTINDAEYDRRTEFYFMPNYNPVIDQMVPTRHSRRTCYSEFNRYPNQTEYIKSMMAEKREGALKVLNIGVAQGQEPLTHINSAFELSKNSAKTISDFIDLKTIDILKYPPRLTAASRYLDSSVSNYLNNIYDTRSGKSYWGTPIETVTEKLLSEGEKQDVVLFNNVIQHMNISDENLLKFSEQLADLVSDKGVMCFTMENDNHSNREYYRRYIIMLNALKNKGFSEISKGIYKRINN